MKIARYFLFLALAALSASAAFATPVDPIFHLQGGKLSTPVTDGTFSFAADNTTGTTTRDFAFDFINQSGYTAKQLVLSFIISPLDLIISVEPHPTASDPFFTTAQVIPPKVPGGKYTIVFFGLDATHPGILSQTCVVGPDGIKDADDCTGGGADFVIAISGVPPGGFIAGTGSIAPEPAAATYFALGLVGIAFALRKTRAI